MMFFALLAVALTLAFVFAFAVFVGAVMLIALIVVLQHVFGKREPSEACPPVRAPLPKAQTVHRPPRSASR